MKKISIIILSTLSCCLFICSCGNKSEIKEKQEGWWIGYKPDLNQATFLNNLGKDYEMVIDSLKNIGYELYSIKDKDEFLFGKKERTIHLTNDTTNHSYFIDCNSKTKKIYELQIAYHLSARGTFVDSISSYAYEMEKQIKKMNPKVEVKITEDLSGYDNENVPYKDCSIWVTIK